MRIRSPLRASAALCSRPSRLATTSSSAAVRCGSSCAPRTVSVAAGATRLVRVRFKSNRATLRQIQKLTKHAPKKLRKRSKLFLKLVATDSGGARTKLNRRSALIP